MTTNLSTNLVHAVNTEMRNPFHVFGNFLLYLLVVRMLISEIIKKWMNAMHSVKNVKERS